MQRTKIIEPSEKQKEKLALIVTQDELDLIQAALWKMEDEDATRLRREIREIVEEK